MYTWAWVTNWVVEMSQKYGGIVWDGDKKMDWGQALCRELYGPDWMYSVFYRTDNDQPNPPQHIIEACKKWSSGEWPEWASIGGQDDSA